MSLPSKDVRIDAVKMHQALKIMMAGLSECAGEDIRAYDVFFALHVVGMTIVETGFLNGETPADFTLIKKLAQEHFIANVSKNPELWQKKPQGP